MDRETEHILHKGLNNMLFLTFLVKYSKIYLPAAGARLNFMKFRSQHLIPTCFFVSHTCDNISCHNILLLITNILVFVHIGIHVTGAGLICRESSTWRIIVNDKEEPHNTTKRRMAACISNIWFSNQRCYRS